MYINYEFAVFSDPYNVCLKHFVYPELCKDHCNYIKWLANWFVKSIWLHGIQFLLPEYLPVSQEIFFLFIAYIIFPNLFYYCNDHVIVEVVCSFIM